MMPTREEYELAAKAARIRITWRDKIDIGLDDPVIVKHPLPHPVRKRFPNEAWEPDKDLGDALDLAIRIGAVVDTDTLEVRYVAGVGVCERRAAGCGFSGRMIRTYVPHRVGKAKATCLAIFQTAVKIGRSM
jgi:hypothetical protein